MKQITKSTLFTASFDTGQPELGRRRGKIGRQGNDPARVAQHEAGHAISAYVVGLHIDEVSIKPGKDYLGRCICPNAIYGYDVPATRTAQSKLARDHAIVLYAGLAAESLRFDVAFSFDDSAKHGAWSDHDRAQDLMNRHYSRMNPRSLEIVQSKALRLVRKHQEGIDRLREILIKRKTIRGAELQGLLGELMDEREGVAQRSNSPTGVYVPAKGPAAP